MAMSEIQGIMSARLEAAPPTSSASALVSILTDGILEFVDDAMDSIGVEALIVTALGLYDTYVAPRTPGPDLFDNAAKQIIAVLIRGVHERIHTEG